MKITQIDYMFNSIEASREILFNVDDHWYLVGKRLGEPKGPSNYSLIVHSNCDIVSWFRFTEKKTKRDIVFTNLDNDKCRACGEQIPEILTFLGKLYEL